MFTVQYKTTSMFLLLYGDDTERLTHVQLHLIVLGVFHFLDFECILVRCHYRKVADCCPIQFCDINLKFNSKHANRPVGH